MITREGINALAISNSDVKKLREYCRTKITAEERITLKDCCEDIDYFLTDFMLLNLCEGKSYDKMLLEYDIPRCRKDFYLRCKLALYLFVMRRYKGCYEEAT